MKNFKLKIPQNIEDYRLRHLPAFNTTLENDHSTESQIEVISGISGVGKMFIRELKESQINKIYTHILITFKDFKVGKPKKEITINGKQYTLVDPNKVGYGWWMDYNSITDKTDNALICALMYVEKGMRYAQIDDSENVLNPAKERALIFEEHFPMVDFMTSRVFFLSRLNRSQIASIQGTLIAQRIIKAKKLLSQKLQFFKRTKQPTL